MIAKFPKPYEPNPALRALYQPFFAKIQVDEAWVQAVRRLAREGSIVYVLRSRNFIDFLALDDLTKRYSLPQIRYVNDLGLWILNPLGQGWLNAIKPQRHSGSHELEQALEHGGSAVLFLKRPPGVLDVAAGASGGRGLKEGDALVRRLFELQRRRDTPILLVPQVFVWTKFPDRRSRQWFDLLMGPREWPSALRTMAQFFYNYKHVELKLGEPIQLSAFLDNNRGATDSARVRRLTYALLARLERERRSVTGPAEKPPERVRQEIVRSPRLRSSIEDLTVEPKDRLELTTRALGMLHELQARPDWATIKFLEVIFDRLFTRVYAGIEFDKNDVERLREAAKQGTLILLPSHKSHIDYLVLSYIFNSQNLPLPLIAAGDNLNFFPVGAILRRGGAFFIRRSFRGDRLYAAVVDAYVRRLIRDGYPIELFLEGGRSRTGKLLPPKFGILNMIVDAALAVPEKRTFFAPVSIGYERVIETSSYERELKGGEKSREDAAGLLKSSDVLRHRYGRINMQVGQLLTLDDFRSEPGESDGTTPTPAKRRALVTRLGNRVMDEINRVTAVTPGALTALVLLSHAELTLSHPELVERCGRLLLTLERSGARISPMLRTAEQKLRAESIREACQMFLDAELLEAERSGQVPGESHKVETAGPGVRYTVISNKRLALDTSKNIIVHFFVERALVAFALLASPAGQAPLKAAEDNVQYLSRLFKFEFRFRADASFPEIFQQTLQGMVQTQELTIRSGCVAVGPGHQGLTGLDWMQVYAAILLNFLEGYRISARALSSLLKAPQTEKELLRRALTLGHRMLQDGEIKRPEAISKSIVQNAFQAFMDQKYLTLENGRLDLGPLATSGDTLGDLERKIAQFIPELRA